MSPPVLEVTDLVKEFPLTGGALLRRQVGVVHAVNGVSFTIDEGETLALVGESGCGKSTTGRVLLGLQPATSGSVRFRGQELTGLREAQLRPLRKEFQIVFQDPYASLDPRMSIGAIIAEPLQVHRRWDRRSGPARVTELMELVGLAPDQVNRFPSEFSGGQRQRVGIARALALEPSLLILDEPVSALDVSIQAGVVNLLEELQDRLGLAYLFIAHDLSVVRHIADRVAVMYLGQIVEIGTNEEVFGSSRHPYTQALISAVPVPDPAQERQRRRIVLQGDMPSPVSLPSGCFFRTRCQVFRDQLNSEQRQRCLSQAPALESTPASAGPGHAVACHFPVVGGARG